MGRIRNVKPEFFLHEELFDLEQETGLPLRLAYIGLWTCADREGRFKWRPRQLKSQILPYDEIDFSRVLDALTTRGFLVRYASGEGTSREEYACIPSWRRNQWVNAKEAASELPAPPQGLIESATSTREARESHASSTREARVPEVEVEVEVKGVCKTREARVDLNRQLLPATPTAAEAEKQNHTHAPSKAKNQSFTADDLGPMLVAHLAELGYSIQGPLKVAKAAVKCVSEAAAFWGVSLEQAFERLRDAQELYVASPAGKRAKPKPALWLYEDGSLMDDPATWDNPDCYTSQKAAQAETLTDDAAGKPVAPEDRPYWQKFPNGRWYDVRREVSRYYTNARTRDCLEAKLHPGYKENLRPLTEAELKVCGRSVYEFSQWATWGEVRYPEPFPQRDCVKWAREKEKTT